MNSTAPKEPSDSYERNFNSHSSDRQEIVAMVHRPERPDDRDRRTCHRAALGGWNRGHGIFRLAVCLQRPHAPRVRLAHTGYWLVLWELLVGVVYVVAGTYLLLNPVTGMVSLTLGLAIYLFAEGLLEFILGFRLRPMPGSGWLFVDGVITLLLAVLILRTWPVDSVWVLGTLLGISMLFSGMARLMISLAARRLATDLT
jgi:hypothetical protein